MGLILALVLFASNAAATQTVATEGVPKPPRITAKAHILVDADSARVLSEQNADTALEPASLTKIMTVYALASGLKHGDIQLDDEVVVSEKAWKATGSRTFIEVAKRVKVQDLLLGVIVQSGNDANIALAEHLSGTEEVFAELMNLYAARVGLARSRFMNSTGLPHPDHRMTARDVAKLTAALIRDYPEIYKWFSIKEYSFNGIPQRNRNRLLWLDPAVDGVKTGHTESAGYCLVASARREQMRLISVILGSESESARTHQSQALLNYGFRFYETHRLFSALQPVTRVRVWKGEKPEVALGLEQELFVTILKRQSRALRVSVDLPQEITAPLSKGERKGVLKVALGDSGLLNRPLVTLQPVAEGGIIHRVVDELRLLLKQVN